MVVIENTLKIKIVEHNNEVLPIIIDDIGDDSKSGENVALVRFDTFADFLVPKDVQADEIETLDHLGDLITNDCWILPAVYRGCVKTIFWFKPPWAHEFQDGVYQFQVGKCQQTGLLKIASIHPYFTSNCVYSSSDKLSNVQTADVYICTAGLAKNYATTIEKSHEPIYDDDSGRESSDPDHRKKVKLSQSETNHNDSTAANKRIYPLDATLINQLLESKPFLVDVDLSFFSSEDSIRKQFDENEYEILRYVYTRIVHDHSDAEILQYIAARENALEQIRVLMEEYLTDPKPEQNIANENLYLAALIAIIRYKKLDWKAVHNYGMHLSDTRPPSHVSSEGMIIYLIESMSKVLQSIKKPPMLITISRCVADGFCTLDQADLIQLYAEKKLQKLYKIDEITGKRLSKPSTNDDDNEVDSERMLNQDQKSTKANDEETNHRAKNDTLSDERTVSNEATSNNRASAQKNETDIGGSSSSSAHLDHQLSPSPPKSNLSPGEIKAISPSSLSEASPLSS